MTVGDPVLSRFLIANVDRNAGTDNDLCAEGADGYTDNEVTDTVPPYEYAQVYFCDRTFNEVFDADESGPVPRITDLTCENFKFDGRYKVTDEMDFIGSTIFHGMMHFNLVSSAAFPTTPITELGPGND